MIANINKIALATLAGALAILATPASAGGYADSYGHGHSHGHVRYAHVQHHSHHSQHSYHKPTYSYGHVHHQPVHYKPHYVQPHYVKPAYVETKTSYEKRPAYVYQKVSGYCVDVVKTHGYQQHRKTVECKAGEYKKAEAPVEQAPAPEQPPVEPQK